MDGISAYYNDNSPYVASHMADLRTRLPGVDIRAARAFRRGTLAGLGNAIVPQVAAEFIKSFMETIPGGES